MRALLLVALALVGLNAQAFELQPYSASYTADWKQVPISGTAGRSLKALDNGRWELDFEASMLVASLKETSTLRMESDAFLPLTYRFDRSGLGKSKQVELDFDWTEKQVLGNDRGEPVRFPLNRGLMDKSTYQLVLQHDVAAGKQSVSYQVIDGDEIETYDYSVLGEERVRDPTQSSRKTVLWFAKDWNYLLVRLHQVEKDGKEYQIMLKEGEVNGRKVVGAKN